MSRFLLTICVSVVFLSKIISGELDYGDNCDPNETHPEKLCRLSDGIACSNDTKQCDCVFPDDMVYFPVIRECEVLLNGPCSYMGEYFSCIAGTCYQSSGICECPSYQAPSQDRLHCLKSHGDTCNETVSCATSLSLLCLDGMCECKNPLMQSWDSTQKACVKAHGAACTVEENADCDAERSSCEVDPLSHTGYSCQCDRGKGYSPTYDGICYKSHNQTCGDGDLCNDDAGLFCRNNVCRCKYEDVEGQRWSLTKQICASLEGYNCDIMDDAGNKQCDDGLECISSFGPLEGFCRKSAGSPEVPKPDPTQAAATKNYQTVVAAAYFLIVSGLL